MSELFGAIAILLIVLGIMNFIFEKVPRYSKEDWSAICVVLAIMVISVIVGNLDMNR